MSVDDDNVNFFPFANCELAVDVHLELVLFQKPKYTNETKTKKKSTQSKSNGNANQKSVDFHGGLFHIYFENSENENNFLTFIPYSGPSNTLHLATNLYLPQLISNRANNSTVCVQRFIANYDKMISELTPSLETMFLSVYIRFGILYVIRPTIVPNQPMPLKEFNVFRKRGRQMRTAFYTCKGVTSPKHLLTTITKLNYHQISLDTYSYEIQLYGLKQSQYSVLHFQYDEQFQCRSIHYRPSYPINFDFIRDKTSSIFRSIDHSYSDIFDFRIQLSQGKHLTKLDPDVVDTLRGVPIDQVLFFDSSTRVLQISPKLKKFVKYFKCIRTSNYQNFDEQILFTIGTYEEFQFNSQGQCEPLMKASNTMTIELLNVQPIPSGQKLYDIGMWFSTLCQTCVQLPTKTFKQENTIKSCQWFSDIPIFRKKYNHSVKQLNVNQLTTYGTQQSNKTYTSDELAFVKKILHEENVQEIFLNANEEKCSNRKELDQVFESMKKKLKTTAAPAAHEALRKIERIYNIVSQQFDE